MNAARGSRRLVVAGGGNMGAALVEGLVANGWGTVADVTVIEPEAARRAYLDERFPGLDVAAGPGDLKMESEGDGPQDAVLAVKPETAEGVARALAEAGVKRVLSVVAGMPAERLETAMGAGAPVVVRAMPNTAVLHGVGVSAIAGGSHASATDLEWAEGILGSVGAVVRLPARHLDAVTGLSGSGPAYVFMVAEALIEGGVLAGLPRDIARTLTIETIYGAATMMRESVEDPASLRAKVTSPGGTTAAGMRALEQRAVRSAMIEAVAAATERSRNLSRS